MAMISNQLNYFCEIHFIFRENTILLQGGALPDESIMRKCLEHNIACDWFAESDHNYSAVLLERDAPNPSGCDELQLREFFWKMRGSPEKELISSLAARARGLFNFRSQKRYCSMCGGALRDDEHFTARTCVQCGHLFFPQLEPAVIVLISRGNEILLARHKNRNDDMYSCIAGFVELGETIEECVHREIMEETSLTVKDVRYVASQAWPFPDQLMLAFRAEYENGEIKVQEEEIREAHWFRRNSLPHIPGPGSVAYNLIMGEFEKK
jgi:NAD+ diphosphatase